MFPFDHCDSSNAVIVVECLQQMLCCTLGNTHCVFFRLSNDGDNQGYLVVVHWVLSGVASVCYWIVEDQLLGVWVYHEVAEVQIQLEEQAIACHQAELVEDILLFRQ